MYKQDSVASCLLNAILVENDFSMNGSMKGGVVAVCCGAQDPLAAVCIALLTYQTGGGR